MMSSSSSSSSSSLPPVKRRRRRGAGEARLRREAAGNGAFMKLPEEALRGVVEFLDLMDLRRCQAVSKCHRGVPSLARLARDQYRRASTKASIVHLFFPVFGTRPLVVRRKRDESASDMPVLRRTPHCHHILVSYDSRTNGNVSRRAIAEETRRHREAVEAAGGGGAGQTGLGAGHCRCNVPYTGQRPRHDPLALARLRVAEETVRRDEEVSSRLASRIINYDGPSAVSCNICQRNEAVADSFVLAAAMLLSADGHRIWAHSQWGQVYSMHRVESLEDLGTIAAAVFTPALVMLLVCENPGWQLWQKRDAYRRLLCFIRLNNVVVCCRRCCFSRAQEDAPSLAEEVRERGGRVRDMRGLLADIITDEAFPQEQPPFPSLAAQIVNRHAQVAFKYLRWQPSA
jgi:hypothetical protein